MKIGYDAKRIFHNTTGLGNYSRDLLSIMSELYKNFDYYLYNPKKKKIDRFKFKNNTFEKLPNRFFWKLISGYWRQGPIVKQLKNDAISIYHGLTGELPQGIHKTNIKTVVTIHDLIFLRYPKLYSIFDRKIHYSKAKFAANKADKIIAISEQTKRDIVDYLDIKENKIEVIYQGCHSSFKILKDETEKSKVRKKFNLPKKFILNVGAINKRKNIITLLSSLRNINSTLIIVGSKTSFFENVKTFIVENNLNDKVFFLDNVSMEELSTIYQLSTVFVYPSIFEGFGIPIIEALYSKTPVITSTGGCFSEAGGPNSIYVDSDDEKGLAEKIKLVLSNKDLRNEMTDKGFIYAQKFNDDIIAEKIYNLYTSL